MGSTAVAIASSSKCLPRNASASWYDLPVIADERRLDDLVVASEREFAGFQVEREREKVEHVARIECRRIGGNQRGKIRRADDLHAADAHDLAGPRPLDVAALLDGAIDDDRAGLHRGNGIGLDELRRRTAGNQRR